MPRGVYVRTEEQKKRRSQMMKGAFQWSKFCESHPHSRLNNSQVIEIRKLFYSKKMTRKQLSEKYGVSYVAIDNIIKKKTWSRI